MKKEWVQEGPLAVSFHEQPTGSKNTTELVKTVIQPDRNRIMLDTQIMRDEASLGGAPKDLSFGRLVGRLPLVDALRLKKEQPDLFSPDMAIAKAATIKFFNSSEGKPYRIQRA